MAMSFVRTASPSKMKRPSCVGSNISISLTVFSVVLFIPQVLVTITFGPCVERKDCSQPVQC